MKELIKHIRKVELKPGKQYLIMLPEEWFSNKQATMVAESLSHYNFHVLIWQVKEKAIDKVKIIEGTHEKNK